MCHITIIITLINPVDLVDNKKYRNTDIQAGALSQQYN